MCLYVLSCILFELLAVNTFGLLGLGGFTFHHPGQYLLADMAFYVIS